MCCTRRISNFQFEFVSIWTKARQRFCVSVTSYLFSNNGRVLVPKLHENSHIYSLSLASVLDGLILLCLVICTRWSDPAFIAYLVWKEWLGNTEESKRNFKFVSLTSFISWGNVRNWSCWLVVRSSRRGICCVKAVFRYKLVCYHWLTTSDHIPMTSVPSYNFCRFEDSCSFKYSLNYLSQLSYSTSYPLMSTHSTPIWYIRTMHLLYSLSFKT